MSDKELIVQLREGSEAAFRSLVEKYQKLVVNTCYDLVHNREDAEDIAQEVFVEVYRSIQNFRADARLSTWLYRIAVNRSLNHLRDNKKHRWFRSFENDVQEKNRQLKQVEGSSTDEPGFGRENRQRATILHEAIGSLPEKQKVAFTPRYRAIASRGILEYL